MTQEDIIRMAREAHRRLVTEDYPGHTGQLDPWTLRLLARFAALVAAAEREACAKVCEELRDDWLRGWGRYEFMGEGADYCADAIRARGNK